jgi:hypothetical protein
MLGATMWRWKLEWNLCGHGTPSTVLRNPLGYPHIPLHAHAHDEVPPVYAIRGRQQRERFQQNTQVTPK